MNESDKKDFATMLYGVGEIHDKPITKELLKFYFGILADYSIDEIRQAVNKHELDPKHGTFFPKPADIVRHIKSNEVSVEDKAALAWIQVESAIRRIGSYGTLELEDKQALAAVKALGSWKDLCMTPSDKIQWKQKEFISVYETYENTPVELLPNKLPGIEDLQNHRRSMSTEFARLQEGIEQHRIKHKDK